MSNLERRIRIEYLTIRSISQTNAYMFFFVIV
nr:MAG TPA: hypothetical protein [Caudoviricetes sp.]